MACSLQYSIKDTAAEAAAVFPGNNISCFSSVSVLLCSDTLTRSDLARWVASVHKHTATLPHTPMAGASDQCTGKSFASSSPCGDSSHEAGVSKCVSPTRCIKSAEPPFAMIHKVGEWTTDRAKGGQVRWKFPEGEMEYDQGDSFAL